jgi:capsular polysaccharide biosynthesis protein
MSSRNRMALRRRWWLLPIVMFFGLFGGYMATAVTAPTYKATCLLFVTVNSQTDPSQTYAGAQLSEDRVASYLPLIKGDWVAWEVKKRFAPDMSASDLESRIEATAEPKSVLINVSFSDSNSQRSAELATAVCEEFVQVASEIERPNSQTTVKLVQKASTPQYPVSPSLQRNLAAGALAGLLAGSGLVLLVGRIWPDPAGAPDLKTVEPDHDASERHRTRGWLVD